MSAGAVFYRGPSMLDGQSIVGLLSGLEGESNNPKTGPVIQAYILRSDKGPMAAVRDGSDVSICGDCKLRGDGAAGRRCYVTTFHGPAQVYKQFILGNYHEASWPELQALVEGRAIRLGAYGDPAAIPFEVWTMLLATAAGHVAYTHQWAACDERFKTIAMASVDTEKEFFQAGLRGWRTFRIRMPGAPLIDRAEFACPASDEMAHRTTCDRCQLCRGTSSPARSVAIVAHGKPSNLKAFGIDRRSQADQHLNRCSKASLVCPACGEDLAAADGARLCATCLERGWSERPCAGTCGKTILSNGVKTHCPDCQLARGRERFKMRVSERQAEEMPA